MFKSITVSNDKRFWVTDAFKKGSTYFLLINYIGSDDDYDAVMDHPAMTCKFVRGDYQNGELIFKDINTDIEVKLSLDCEATRNSIRIFEEMIIDNTKCVYEHLWCDPNPSAFDSEFFVVGHAYKVQFDKNEEHKVCILKSKAVDHMRFSYWEPWSENKGTIIEKHMSERQYRDIMRIIGKKAFISLMDDKWSC